MGLRITRNILLNEQRGEQRRRALGVRLADATASPYADPDADLVVNRVDLGSSARSIKRCWASLVRAATMSTWLQ